MRIVHAAKNHSLEEADDCVDLECTGTLVSGVGQFSCNTCAMVVLLPQQTAAELLKELKAARVAYANHRRAGSLGYGFNVK